MMTPVPVRFPPAMRKELDRIMEARLDEPNLGAVVRELVAEALAQRAKRSKS